MSCEMSCFLHDWLAFLYCFMVEFISEILIESLSYLTTGLGSGMVNISTNTVITTYFKEKRSIALSLFSVGTGIGTISVAYLVTFILEEYGFQGAHLLIAGICLNMCVSGCLYRPAREQLRRTMAKKALHTQKDIANEGSTKRTKNNTHTSERMQQKTHLCEVNNRGAGGRKANLKCNSDHPSFVNLSSDGALDNKIPVTVHEQQPGRRKLVQTGPLPSSGTGIASVTSRPMVTDDSSEVLHHTSTPDIEQMPTGQEGQATSEPSSATCGKNNTSNGANVTLAFLTVSMFCFSLAASSNNMFLPSISHERHISSKDMTLLIVILGIVEFISAPPWGAFLDFGPVNRHRPKVYAGILIYFGICIACLGRAESLVTIALCVGLQAFVQETVFVQLAAVVGDIAGGDLLDQRYGIVSAALGVGVVAFPLAAGKFLNVPLVGLLLCYRYIFFIQVYCINRDPPWPSDYDTLLQVCMFESLLDPYKRVGLVVLEMCGTVEGCLWSFRN